MPVRAIKNCIIIPPDPSSLAPLVSRPEIVGRPRTRLPVTPAPAANDSGAQSAQPKSSAREPSAGKPDPAARAPYDVGDRKPPVHTRWKPGQSGNPGGYNGKQKKARTIEERQKTVDDYILDIYTKPITVQTAQGEKRMDTVEIALLKLRELVNGKSYPAIKQVLTLVDGALTRRESRASSEAAQAGPRLGATDAAILASVLAQLDAIAPPIGGSRPPHPQLPITEGSDDNIAESE